MAETGYGYGIWLVIEDDRIQDSTQHIAHVTLVCNMNLDRATDLYDMIEEHFNYNIPMLFIDLNEENKEGTLFDTGMYSASDSDMDPISIINSSTKYAWGYYCSHSDMNILKIEQMIREYMIENDFCGSMSPRLHITMEYDKDIFNIVQNVRESTFTERVKCTIKLVDITSNSCEKWKIIR